METRNTKPAASGERQAGRRSDHFEARDYIQIRPGTKEYAILSALAAGRSLNRFQAARLHDTCLNSTVATLQSKGVRIHREWETVPCVGGTKTVTVCRYSLPAGEIAHARRMLGLDEQEVAA